MILNVGAEVLSTSTRVDQTALAWAGTVPSDVVPSVPWGLASGAPGGGLNVTSKLATAVPKAGPGFLMVPLTVANQNATLPLLCEVNLAELMVAVGAGGHGAGGDGLVVGGVGEASDAGIVEAWGAVEAGETPVVTVVDPGVVVEAASGAPRLHAVSPIRNRVATAGPNRRTALSFHAGTTLTSSLLRSSR